MFALILVYLFKFDLTVSLLVIFTHYAIVDFLICGFMCSVLHSSKLHIKPLILSAGPGEPFLPPQHRPGSDHQAEGDPLCRVHSLHEGSESHPDPDPSAGGTVHPPTLETRGTHQPDRLRILHNPLLQLSGTCNSKELLTGLFPQIKRIQTLTTFAGSCDFK